MGSWITRLALAIVNRCAAVHAGHPRRCWWVWASVAFTVVMALQLQMEIRTWRLAMWAASHEQRMLVIEQNLERLGHPPP